MRLSTSRGLAVQALTVIKPRTTIEKICVAGPLLLLAAGQSLAAAVYRACGGQHPHGWTLQEEMLVILMRTLLAHGDIGVWRGFFRNVSSKDNVPPDLLVTQAAREGSKSLWFQLKEGLRAAEPRASFNLVFVHGGAFIAGSARQYQATYCVWLKELASRGINCKVLSIEYPLAPEHPFPAGRDACEADIVWLMDPEQSGEADPVVVGGDSAGGNLAMSSLAHLRDTGRLPVPPLGVLLVSPAVDMSDSCTLLQPLGSCGEAASHDYLPRDKLTEGLPHFYAKDLSDPYVSPTHLTSFDGLALKEFMVVSGGLELLLPDIKAFAEKLQAAAPHPPGAPTAAATDGDRSGAANAGGGSGWTVTYLEEPRRVHSWPLLMLPHLRPMAAPIFDFFERVLGLQEPRDAATAAPKL